MIPFDVDERIRAALNAAADEMDERDLRPADPPTGVSLGARNSGRRARWGAITLAAAAVVAVAVGVSAIVSSQPSAHQHAPAVTGPAPRPKPTPYPTTTPVPTTRSAPIAAPRPTASAVVPPTSTQCVFADLGCVAPGGFYNEPLWPFASYAQARQWETSGGGAQPWHADAAETALLFARNYLGFADITTVTSTRTDAAGAHIGVGYALPNGAGDHAAAVLHLLRYAPSQSDSKGGWEVVGSDDTDFSLELPAYGSRVASPATVGGHVTGVDENIVIVVRNQAGTAVGSAPSVPAGGTNNPWLATAHFSGGGVLTIVAFTGGHLTQHERFAVQGVHTA